MYNELVYHLDLCILSYQLYGQTLVWPMDPYYEWMRRKGTSRRDNVMLEVREHEELLGEGYNPKIDPIVFNYKQLNPWTPCFVKPEDTWDVFNAPTPLVEPIRRLYMEKSDVENYFSINKPGGTGRETDDVYCFEGETGVIKDSVGAKSFVGFVMARQLGDNPAEYDVHVVFRGSRSGSAERAFMQGKFREKGNPDWITDMDFGVLIKNEEISTVGEVCRGFQSCILRMKTNILTCFGKIHTQRNAAPRKIFFTGHSLGGALATQCASSLINGDVSISPQLRTWPFKQSKVYTFGSPVVGNRDFCEFFGVHQNVIRVIIDGDPITQEKFNLKGTPWTSQTHPGTLLKLPSLTWGRLLRHEPMYIRKSLLVWLKKRKIDVSRVPANSATSEKFDDTGDEPWIVCKKFVNVLEHRMFRGENAKNIRTFMPTFTTSYLRKFITHLNTALDSHSSYKTPMTSKETRRAKINAIYRLIEGFEEERDTLKKIDRLLMDNEKPIDDSDTLWFVGMCMLIRRFIEVPGDAAALLRDKADYAYLSGSIEKI